MWHRKRDLFVALAEQNKQIASAKISRKQRIGKTNEIPESTKRLPAIYATITITEPNGENLDYPKNS